MYKRKTNAITVDEVPCEVFVKDGRDLKTIPPTSAALPPFFKQVFFKKNAYVVLVFFNPVPYMQISDVILGVNIIDEKVIVVSINRAEGFVVVLRPQRGV